MSAYDALFARGRVLMLDGALGSELERRGYPCPLPLWSAGAVLEQPGLLWEIHRDYVTAGADVLDACTFRTTRYTLAKVGMAARAEELTHQAVRLARSAASESAREILVSGCIGPVEDCYQPELVPQDEILRSEHTLHARYLADAGVDFLFLETHNNAREVLIAAECARKTGLPVWASVVARDAMHVLNGDELMPLAQKLVDVGVEALLVNCCSPKVAEDAFLTIRRFIGELGRRSQPLLGAYPNIMSEDLSAQEFSKWCARLVDQGAAIVGGCCGVGPEHIAEAAGKFQNQESDIRNM